MAGEFAMFLPRIKNFNVLPTYCSIDIIYQPSAINNFKTMGGGHAVHEQQATTVVISLYGEERADPQRGVAVIT